MTVASQFTDMLTRRGALDRIAERERTRLIIEATCQGLTHREISKSLGTMSQATITRLLKRVEDDPHATRVMPAEIIDRHAVGEIDTDEMMRQLIEFGYSFGSHPTVNGHETDAYMSGDFDEVEQAFYRGLLTEEQFQTLADRQAEIVGIQSRR